MSEFVIEVNDSNFDSEVTNSSLPVFLDFWAPWCGPCRMVAPVVDELAGEMKGKVKFAKVNIDESPNTASRFGIMSIPTLLVVKGGQIVGQQVGAVPKSTLKSMIENSL
ncbi:MAG TPA: thioredoxin [Acidobacteriota bacterium]|jgi:thioredoxin 1|nr:thioredoxin [Acidobacteriota bacterium]HNT16552.1 thioredoxin [Acidobacteriota bacterium]HPA26824.1 thioredoxin [Acidobacteriota bacterium]HQO19035.1 thioredoxin [Acidobacteriota bacterium]HQQ45928.1 thioredoxin [Acidobacteriota bacterium]